jgi:hypothetical protein
VKELTVTSENLRLNLGVTLNDAKTQLVAEVQAQFADMKNSNIISAHDQVCSKFYFTLLGSLPERIAQLIRESRKITTAQRALQSLLFEDIRQREDQIRDAYAKTFTWIFEDETTSFKRWLISGTGTFWVSGKAGSGKSTLMKFLANHETTKTFLRHWSGAEDLVVASFYFWGVGHETQKTQLGLMKTLLYQILRQCPELIPSVLPSRFSTGNNADFETYRWTRQELSNAVDSIIARRSLKSKFCFFVDGLDEYVDEAADEHQTLIQYLDHLTESSHVKLCVSSRPWNALTDRYGKCDDLKFILQDLTSEDMLRYAQGLLQQNERFQRLAVRDSQALSLATQIRDRAEGVFLWVHLVTQSLKRGLSEHDDTIELERRLAQTPSDLIEFFHSIFRNIDDNYKDYTMRALQIAAIALPMPLGAFQYVSHEVDDHTYAIRQGVHFNFDESATVDLLGLTPPAPTISHEEIKVNKWCRDLLEVRHDKNSPESGIVFVPGEVQFLHRTVKEFLLTTEMQDRFLKNSVCIPSPRKAVCRMYLAYTKSCCGMPSQSLVESVSIEVNTGNVLRWAKLCEVHDQATPFDVLNELEETRIAAHIVGKFYGRSRLSMLRLVVREDLLLYVENTPGRDIRAERGILWTALFPIPNDLAMISKLLKKGCSPNDGWAADGPHDGSVWQKLIEEVHYSELRSHKPAETAQIIAFLLLHGADPNAKYNCRLNLVPLTPPGYQDPGFHSREVLMQVFNDDGAKVDALRAEARKVRSAAAPATRPWVSVPHLTNPIWRWGELAASTRRVHTCIGQSVETGFPEIPGESMRAQGVQLKLLSVPLI